MNENAEEKKAPSALELFDFLKDACAGKNFAAVRVKTKLLPMAGKVFPPTYQGGQYATEGEKRNGQGEVEAAESVLLDSVQSQANRMELALLNAINTGLLKLPIIRVNVDFTQDGQTYRYPNINSYTVPHRVSDAIIRDSLITEKENEKETKEEKNATPKHFWESEIGSEITEATIHNARAFFKYCPTALLFGTWDSHSFVKRGLNKTKVARALCSEIIGVDAKPGKRTASRVDPLHLSGFYLVQSGKGEYEWNTEQGEPERDEKKRAAKKQLKVSELGHGNVTPDFKSEKGEKYPGGFQIKEAMQTALLLFAQLRRLSFAQNIDDLISINPKTNQERLKTLNEVKETMNDDKQKAAFPQREFQEIEKVNVVGRAVIAALGLVAISLLQEAPDAFNLRSRCDLSPAAEPLYEFLPLRGEKGKPYEISPQTAIDTLTSAVAEAEKLGLCWRNDPIELELGPELKKLIVASEKAQESE